MQYQKDFSKLNNSMLDIEARRKKARKIFLIIRDFLRKDKRKFSELVCLDIGGSTGFSAMEFSPVVKKVYIIDIDKKALDFGKKINKSENIFYKVDDAMNLSFKDESIDIIICNQVYEHVPNQRALIKEICRVLKNDGVCYFGAGNKLDIIEHHYKLPFLSWMPKKMANMYIKKFRGYDIYYENHLTYFSLKKLLKPFFIYDYTINVIKNPTKYSATDIVRQDSPMTKMPYFILKIMEPFMPGYIFLLKKS